MIPSVPLNSSSERTHITAAEDEWLIRYKRCVCAPLAGSERQEGRWRRGVRHKIAEQSFVAEAEKEFFKPRGGLESHSSCAIREVKQFIIT